MNKLLALCGILLLSSCDFLSPTMATDEQKKQALDNATFDKKIISEVNIYDSLVNFLFTNRDSILAYRNSRNVVIQVEGGRKDTVLEREVCYTFFQSNSNYDISNVPDFLKLELARLFNAVKSITSFRICLTGQVEIEVKSDNGSNGLNATHTLIWNTNSEDRNPYSRSKDTLINYECVYRIGIDEHHGH